MDHFHHEWDLDHVNALTNVANKIFQLYVATNAPLAVNLPSKIRLKTEERLKQNDIKRDVFDSAATEIYQVMNRDSFARFKLSSLWKEYVKHPERHPDGAPPPAVKRLADCYTGRRNSESLMQHIGTQTIKEVISNDQGYDSYMKFLEVDSETDGCETLRLVKSIKEYREFVAGLGIARSEDLFEIEDNVKMLIEKHFNAESSKHLPESLLQAKQTIDATVADANHGVKAMCTIFDEVGLLAIGFLDKDTFQRFINSALFIKYRMAIVKQQSLTASLENKANAA